MRQEMSKRNSVILFAGCAAFIVALVALIAVHYATAAADADAAVPPAPWTLTRQAGTHYDHTSGLLVPRAGAAHGANCPASRTPVKIIDAAFAMPQTASWNGLHIVPADNAGYALVGRPLWASSGEVSLTVTVECGASRHRDIVTWPIVINGTHPHAPESRYSHHDHHHQHTDQHPTLQQQWALQTRVAQQDAEIHTLATRVHHIQTAVGRLITTDED